MPSKLCLRVRAVRLGGHTHVTIWAGMAPRVPAEDRYSGLGNAGTIVLRNEEWAALRRELADGRRTEDERADWRITEEEG